MFKKVEEQIQKAIKRYLRKQGRVGFDLREINELLKDGPPIQNFHKTFQQKHPLLAVLKLFLLLHRVTIDGTQHFSQLLGLVSSLNYQPSDDFEKLLSTKLMEPYRLYLQRRMVLYSEEVSLARREQRQARVYKLLNLINLATSFSDIIYLFGRYYMDKFTCAIDFNIVLGADLQGIYQEMIDNVIKPASKPILEEIESVHEKMYVVYYNCYFHRYLKCYIPRWVITDLLAHRKFQTPQKDSSKSTMVNTATTKRRTVSSAKPKSGLTASLKKKTDELNLGESYLFLNAKVEEQMQNEEEERPQQEIFDPRIKVTPQRQQPRSFSLGKTAFSEKERKQLDLLQSMERVMSRFGN